jgi:hypothetical protein
MAPPCCIVHRDGLVLSIERERRDPWLWRLRCAATQSSRARQSISSRPDFRSQVKNGREVYQQRETEAADIAERHRRTVRVLRFHS